MRPMMPCPPSLLRAYSIRNLFLALIVCTCPVPLAAAVEEVPRPVGQSPQLEILGCELTLDFLRTQACIAKAVEREAAAAERRGRDIVQKQLNTAQSQLFEAQRQLAAAKRELENVEKAANRQVNEVAARGREFVKTLPADALLTTDWYLQATQLLAAQAPLFACLEKDPSFDFIGAANGFAKNPGEFLQSQLRTSIIGLRTHWATLMKSELNQLASGRVVTRDPAATFAAASDKLAQVAQMVPGGRCLLTHVGPLVNAQAQQAAREILPVLEKEMRTILTEQIVPQIQKGVSAQLRDAFQQLTGGKLPPASPGSNLAPLDQQFPFLRGLTLSEAELRGIARGVLLDRQFEKLKPFLQAVATVERIAANPGATQTQLAAARTGVIDALNPTPDWDRLYLAIGVEVIRSVGHKYLDSDEPGHGGFLLNHGVSLMQFGEGTVEKVASALCGLIPEAGAAVCAVIEEGINLAWNQGAVPVLEAVASNSLHQTWNEAMDKAKTEVSAGRSLEKLKDRLGVKAVDVLIGTLPHESVISLWANGLVERDEDLFNQLFGAVGTLAKSATSR